MRTDDDQIGIPLCRGVSDDFSQPLAKVVEQQVVCLHTGRLGNGHGVVEHLIPGFTHDRDQLARVTPILLIAAQVSQFFDHMD